MEPAVAALVLTVGVLVAVTVTAPVVVLAVLLGEAALSLMAAVTVGSDWALA
jgi:hydrogenase/urease accessory protein HupE